MKNFTDIVNRLKTVLSLTQDKQVAEFLGLSKSAFAERKRRGVFPENALRLSDLQHPELKLDLDYILTGESEDGMEKVVVEKMKENKVSIDSESHFSAEIPSTPIDADTAILLNSDEIKLLMYFRKSDMKGKQLMLDTGKMCKECSFANLRLTEYTEKGLLYPLSK